MNKNELNKVFTTLFVLAIFGFACVMYFGGATPFLYPHEFIHGDVPVGSSIQFMVMDPEKQPLSDVPIVLDTYEGKKQLSSDKDGYAYFGMVFWRNTMPVALGKGFENCTFQLGPVYIGSTLTSTIKMYVSCP